VIFLAEPPLALKGICDGGILVGLRRRIHLGNGQDGQAPRTQNPAKLPEGGPIVGNVLENIAGDHHVKTRIGHHGHRAHVEPQVAVAAVEVCRDMPRSGLADAFAQLPFRSKMQDLLPPQEGGLVKAGRPTVEKGREHAVPHLAPADRTHRIEVPVVIRKRPALPGADVARRAGSSKALEKGVLFRAHPAVMPPSANGSTET